MKTTKGMKVKTNLKAGRWYSYSLRRFKKGIRYLSAADTQGLHDALLGFRLATYQYRHEGAGGPEHLGFIIDDVGPGPAVAPNGEMVDLYGFTSMAVAAIQNQARQIEELRREVATLRDRCAQS
jgi:hypothetical protein